MRELLLTFILSITTLSCPTSAQSSVFRGVSMSDGLSDLLVNVIFKDSEGFVWIGTDNCLDRFDGTRIKHYPFENISSPQKRVHSIVEAENHLLWVGNNQGLWQLDHDSGHLAQVAADVIDCPVYALFYNKKGTLYIGTEKGLFIYEQENIRQVLLSKDLFSIGNQIKGINQDESGLLWLATAGGLYQYNPDSNAIQSFHPDFGLPGESRFRNITRIGQTLYLGTENQGIFSFDIKTSIFERFVDVGNNIISSLSSDGNDMIYAGTDGNGIHFLSHSEKRIVHSYLHQVQNQSSIRSNSVYSLLVDKEGIIWVGYYQAGFDYSMYQNGLFTTYAMPPYFDSKDLTVRSFYINGHEKFIGSRDGLYYINETTKQIKLFRMPELRSNLILSITCYNGQYYIGTYGGGLSIIDSQTLNVRSFNISTDAVFHNGHIFCMKQDGQNNLWIGTSNGVYLHNGNTGFIQLFNHINSQMPEGNTYDIFFDSAGKGWICTDNGLAVYDHSIKSMRTNIFPEGFFHKEKIRLVYEDNDHQLFFLPDRGGLFYSDLSMTKYGHHPIHPVIQGNAYSTILQDNEGWIWLGSDNGMIRMNPDKEEYYSFNFTDGILHPTFLYPAYKDDNGKLWFSNNSGLLYVNPSLVDSIKQNPYKIIFTDIRINGNPLSHKRRIETKDKNLLSLKEKENNISLRFVNLLYSDPGSDNYAYKLDNYDPEWIIAHGANEINYYDLKPGKYTFRVRVPGNEQSETVIHLKVGSWITSHKNALISISISLVIIILLYNVYRLRKSLYNKIRSTSKKEIPASEEETSVLKNEEKYKANRLTEKECKDLYRKLKSFVANEKPYLNPDLKIADLAKTIGTSSHSLSYLFNQHLNISYYDFINQYRIEEFKKIATDPQFDRYTLTAMAHICGFSSRASFFRSFKKSTGITPNEYIKSLGLEDKD
ncbi:MAG: helix-turn-helix domain-containing protein [Tannerella sp.]|nr:helix-turn-helix domain-containing protein [Tannerella sp.]